MRNRIANWVAVKDWSDAPAPAKHDDRTLLAEHNSGRSLQNHEAAMQTVGNLAIQQGRNHMAGTGPVRGAK